MKSSDERNAEETSSRPEKGRVVRVVNGPRAEAKAATRAKLIDAALAHMRGHDSDMPTVADVVRGAGVSNGTFYLHFDSVQQLVAVLQQELLGRFARAITPETPTEVALDEYLDAAWRERSALRALRPVEDSIDPAVSPLHTLIRARLDRTGASHPDAATLATLIERAIEATATTQAVSDLSDRRDVLESLMLLLDVVQEGLSRDRGRDGLRAGAPDKTIVVCGERRLTVRELDDRVGRAVTLLRRLGFEQEDRFGVLLTNSTAAVELDLACQRMGMSVVPLNTYWRTREIEHVVHQAKLRGIAFHDEFRSLVDSIDPGLRAQLTLVPVGSSSTGDRYERQITELQPTDIDRPPPAATLFYTSGSTGLPKGIIRYESPSERRRHGLFLASLFGINQEDRLVIAGPLHHAANRLFSNVCRQVGATAILMPHFDAEELLRIVDREQATVAMLVPTMLYRLVKLAPERRERHDISSLRAIVHMGAPCSAELKRQALATFGPIIHEYYGATEMGGTVIGPEEWLRNPGSVGRAWRSDTIVQILDVDGNQVPPDTVGRVALLDPQRAPFRYLDEHGQPEPVSVGDNHLFVTDDLGYLDSEGYLYLADRHSAVFKSGGVAVYPAEVEAVIASDPAVADCAVAGIDDPEWGQVPVAYVQALPGQQLDIDRLRNTVRTQLAHYKCPRSWVTVDQIPRDNAGKLMRRELPTGP